MNRQARFCGSQTRARTFVEAAVTALRLLTIASDNFTPLDAAAAAVSDAELALTTTAAPFGQVFPALLDAQAAVWSPPPDVALVWARPERVLPTFARLLEGEPVEPAGIAAEVDALAGAILAAAARVRVTTLVATFALPADERGLGAADWSSPNGVGATLARANLRLAERLAGAPGVLLLDAARWLASAGGGAVDPKYWFLGKIPYALRVFDEAALDIRSAVAATLGLTRKLLVLDLDHTLWGGIIGDDGWQNLDLGGTSPVGEAHLAFQRAIKALQRRGVALALCSKNDERVALEALERHPEMVLRPGDFAAWRINWRDKAENLRELLDELNLTTRAAVFIDDSPAERARVREAWPDVLVPEWPEDPAQYAAALRRLRCFDVVRVTDEDRARTAGYVAERRRRETRAQAATLSDWLAGLELTVTQTELNDADLLRAAQLLNKTNQFNLTTRRLSEAALRAWAQTQSRRVLTYRVRDRFGDYGLTGLAALEFSAGVATIIDFVLSCRVMGRGVEHTIMERLCEVACAAGCRTIVGRRIPTEKNGPCAEFLDECGFAKLSEDHWERSLAAASTPRCAPARVESVAS